VANENIQKLQQIFTRNEKPNVPIDKMCCPQQHQQKLYTIKSHYYMKYLPTSSHTTWRFVCSSLYKMQPDSFVPEYYWFLCTQNFT